MFCPQCAKPNNESAKYCIGCGTALAVAELTPAEVAAAAARHQEELYKAYIGPKNQHYYLSRFQDFDRAGKAGVSWHWPAFFTTFYWLLYRKMWGHAALYYLLPYLLAVPFGVVVAAIGESAASIGTLAYLAAIFALAPLYANALYYRRARKKIAEVQAMTSDVQRQSSLLAGRGGTSWTLLIVIGLFFGIAIIGILAAVALPAYADYTTRAHLSQAHSVGKSAATAVENYVHQYGSMPADLAATGFDTPLPETVTKVTVDEHDGTVTVAFKHQSIEGSLLEVPIVDEKNGDLIWSCKSDDLENRLLPRECRSEQQH